MYPVDPGVAQNNKWASPKYHSSDWKGNVTISKSCHKLVILAEVINFVICVCLLLDSNTLLSVVVTHKFLLLLLLLLQ